MQVLELPCSLDLVTRGDALESKAPDADRPKQLYELAPAESTQSVHAADDRTLSRR